MYNLYKLDEDLYEIHASGSSQKAFQGTLIGILTYATYKLHFAPDELERGLIDMIENDTNGANFGINRTFIYSFNRNNKKVG